jgi:predicted ribosomally synthesized peptide with nif11-like leader
MFLESGELKAGFNSKKEGIMSTENIRLFYDALAKDEALQDKFKGLMKKYEGQKPDQQQGDAICEEECLPIAKEAGFDFTLEELAEYRHNAASTTARQLSEDELAVVAGGLCVCVAVGYGTLHNGDALCSCVGWGAGSMYSQYCQCFLGGGGG